VTETKAKELATALRLARFRGAMTDDAFAALVKEVVRVLHPMGDLRLRQGFGHFPALKAAQTI